MDDNAAQPERDNKKPFILKRLWSKLAISPIFIILAVKGALPSTIALAAYEADEFAEVYTTLGYLVAIMAHLGLCFQPRAKFVMTMLVNVLFICLGGAIALLEIQCVVAARQTSSSGTNQASGQTQALAYDASSNAVAAVFLCVWVFLANIVKATRPQLLISMIQFSIFTIVTSVYAPGFPNMDAGKVFIRKLLITFLTGHAISTGVALLIFPVTSRSTVTKQMGGLINLVKVAILSEGAYMDTISSSENKSEASLKEKAAAGKVKQTMIGIGELVGKIKLEMTFARKEVAFGKLGPDHFNGIFERMRAIIQPVMGTGSFLEIVKTLREHRSAFAGLPEAQEALESIRKLEVEEWNDVIGLARDSHMEYQKTLIKGLTHIAYQLELEKPPTKAKSDTSTDVEQAMTRSQKPGDAGFTKYLEDELSKWQQQRVEIIQDWAESKHMTLPKHYQPLLSGHPMERQETKIIRKRLNQHQLYLVLYLNYLSTSLGQSILYLAKYADELVDDGTMKKKRFINPGLRRIRKLFSNAFKQSSTDETLTAEVSGGSNIYLGDALNKRRDPEHLPPRNVYEKATNQIRSLSGAFNSEATSFAVRAVCATMTLGVLAYLRGTRTFFLQQRGMWALIMTAISMDPHAGQGLFGFACRILGTAVAMVASIVIWYMCDHNHAAILVLFAIYVSCANLLLIKNPKYAVIFLISSITLILILGYELQISVIGREVAESNGQEAYPVRILAPFRLATVCVGLASAFIWTYFPFPITTHGALRKDMGSTLYILANFYSCTHTTVQARLHMGSAINDLPKTHPINKLDEARNKTFTKVLLMLTRLREHNRFTRFEPPFGGRFPRETYEQLIDSTRNIFTYLSLILYSSQAYINDSGARSVDEVEEEARWLSDFRKFAADTKVTSHEVTSNLCLLSAAIQNSQPLPPYLRAPRAFNLGEKMQDMDPSLLGVQHFAHPCYAAFAVGEVASAFITAEVAKVTKLIKELVGEVDFSFQVIRTNDDSSSTNSTLWEKPLTSNGVDRSDHKAKDD